MNSCMLKLGFFKARNDTIMTKLSYDIGEAFVQTTKCGIQWQAAKLISRPNDFGKQWSETAIGLFKC